MVQLNIYTAQPPHPAGNREHLLIRFNYHVKTTYESYSSLYGVTESYTA